MAQKENFYEEIHRRIEHLHSIPETPSRKREIQGLQKALIESAKMAAEEKSGKKSIRRKLAAYENIEVSEPEPEEPVRRVERTEGRKRVIISTRKPAATEDSYESVREKKASERMKSDIQAMIGVAHRGMS
jgi:hypothetical protein